MAIRLNNSMRVEILANAMEGAFTNVMHEQRIELYKAAHVVYIQCLGERIEYLKNLPCDMVMHSSPHMRIRLRPVKGLRSLNVEVPNNYKYGIDKYINDCNVDACLREKIAANQEQDSFPVYCAYTLNLTTIKPQPRASNVMALVKAVKALEASEDENVKLRRTLSAVLHSAYSVEKLLELWPNAANYLPAIPVVGKTMAINIPALERMLDRARG